MFAHVLRGDTWRVLALALTFKLGLHMASALLKPMAVDFGWSKQRIGYVVVLFGSLGGLAGAAVGGGLHRKLGESNALRFALVLQAAGCLPLVAVERLGASTILMTGAIGLEHFASGLGTTILFAALMTATRPADAGLHYTVLTSANALAIGVGGFVGGLVADHGGRLVAFLGATVVCLLPGVLLPGWTRAANASRGA
jgi:predicted MFS family arabinose efflux permease